MKCNRVVLKHSPPFAVDAFVRSTSGATFSANRIFSADTCASRSCSSAFSCSNVRALQCLIASISFGLLPPAAEKSALCSSAV